MANVSYPQHNLKTIVLPIAYADTDENLAHYKDKYGIDLLDFIYLEGGNAIELKPEYTNALFLVVSEDAAYRSLNSVHVYSKTNWVEGSQDATFVFVWYNPSEATEEGIQLSISKNAPFEESSIITEALIM